MRNDIIIRQETAKDYKDIIALILRSFKEGTNYSDGTDVLALVEEIRCSEYYIPELSFVSVLRPTDVGTSKPNGINGEVVGHFMFSRFPLSSDKAGGHATARDSELIMLGPVAVHAEHFREGIGTAMLTLGIEKAKACGFKGIIVEGNYRFYNRFGFRTSSEFGIYPTSGFPLNEPRCMMCMETEKGSLDGIHGYIVYDMYYNA